jgi:Ankyrin repeats (many copies)
MHPPRHDDPSPTVAAALEAIRAGDVAAFTRLLDAEPGLLEAEGVADGGSDLDHALNLAACFDRVELVHMLLAGAGLVGRLEGFLDGGGGLVPEAYLGRPNPADVGWLQRLPARDVPQDVLDEALVHAAQNERPEAVAWLLSHGADPNAGPYQGCGALHLAAAFGAIECVRLLTAAGADPDRRNDFNGDNAVGWAEYALARERPGDAGVIAVRDHLRGLGSRPAVWGL